MCLGTALWARIDRVYFAADREDAAAAGFDDALFYRFFDGDPAHRDIMPVATIVLPERTAPFDEWNRTSTRVEY